MTTDQKLRNDPVIVYRPIKAALSASHFRKKNKDEFRKLLEKEVRDARSGCGCADSRGDYQLY
ncbi:MAG TPA: hypothetical protein VHM64_09930, partial [Candidatus Binatia bacterium]|nr:hypothetical protein [Candidatus Binatia bacterium]